MTTIEMRELENDFHAMSASTVRAARGLVYFAIACALLYVGEHHISNWLYIAAIIGLLGCGGELSKIARIGLGVLMVLALVPPSVIAAVSG